MEKERIIKTIKNLAIMVGIKEIPLAPRDKKMFKFWKKSMKQKYIAIQEAYAKVESSGRGE